MRNIRKNITIFLYLISVLGLGLASIFTGRIVADRQKKIIPPESKAGNMICAIKCRCEVGGVKYDNGEYFQQMCQSACNLKDERECSGNLEWPCNNESKCNDCWAPVCAPPPTATPTPKPTSTPIPTPTPLPGCWGSCAKDTECSQAPIALVCRPVQGASHCVNPACPSQETCQCPDLICRDLTSDKSVSSLKKEDKIKLTCEGSSGVDQPLNHVKFRAQIDGGSWLDLGTGSGPGFAVDYTIPQTGNYQIECRVCTSTDDSVCTGWGQTGVASP